MTAQSTHRARQRRGTPTGGQFAAVHRAESDLDLDSGSASGRPPRSPRDAARGRANQAALEARVARLERQVARQRRRERNRRAVRRVRQTRDAVRLAKRATRATVRAPLVLVGILPRKRRAKRL